MLVKLSILISSMILCAFSHNSILSIKTPDNFEAKLKSQSPTSILSVNDLSRKNNIQDLKLSKYQIKPSEHQTVNIQESSPTFKHSYMSRNYFNRDFVPFIKVPPKKKPDIGKVIYQHYNKGKDVYEIDEEITYLAKYPIPEETPCHKKTFCKANKHSGYVKRREKKH